MTLAKPFPVDLARELLAAWVNAFSDDFVILRDAILEPGVGRHACARSPGALARFLVQAREHGVPGFDVETVQVHRGARPWRVRVAQDLDDAPAGPSVPRFAFAERAADSWTDAFEALFA